MTHPLPAYHFLVEWGGTRVGFSEGSGLEIEIPAIEYREGSDGESSARKIPGLQKYTDITLKRGIVINDNEFFEWINAIRMGSVERRNITISLLDENHDPVMMWRAVNAWPTRLVGPVLSATENRIAIEELVVTHEGLTIETG